MHRHTTIRTEIRELFVLALPVVIDQVGMMSMGIVDTIMVGHLGPAPLGAVGIGAAVYFFFMVFAWGTISSVSPTVAQAFGRGDRDEIERSVAQGFWLALALFGGGLLVILNIEGILLALGQKPELVAIATPYVTALGWGMVASLWYATLRAFTVGLGLTRVTMVISLLAALLNLVIDWALIYGELGMPRLGAVGAGYATSTVQWFMLLCGLFYVLRARGLRDYRWVRRLFPIDLSLLRNLFRLGTPIGAAQSMEQGVFALTSLLMGQLGEIPVASHQVAISVAAFTFMTPLGIATAVTTRVGQAIGRGDPEAASRGGWVGAGMATLFMCVTCLLFLSIPRWIIGIYTSDAEVLAYASGLLMIAGAFQIFDGIQVAAMGALRGLKDTTVPMYTNLVSYWLVGLPAGYLLAFTMGLGGHGLWWGLTLGLAVAGTLHSLRFRRLTRAMAPKVELGV